jgi:hypothetical protein
MKEINTVVNLNALGVAAPIVSAVLVNAHVLIKQSAPDLDDDHARVAVLQLFSDYLLDIQELAQKVGPQSPQDR